MSLVVTQVATEAVRALAAERLGPQPTAPEALAELVRAELWARGLCLRRSLLDRVQLAIEPVASVDRSVLAELVLAMERGGEFTAGDGGLVAAAPLRAVTVGDHLLRLYGGPPTWAFHDHGSGAAPHERPVRAVVGRVWSRPDGDLSRYLARIDALGGIVLSPAQWAGFDRVGPAGSEWLAQLDRTLRWEGQLDEAAADLDWRVYTPQADYDEQRRRWRAPDDSSTARLWRVWTDGGWFRYAWTEGGRPAQARQIPLTSDEALRTAYSLDRAAEAPLRVRATDTGERVTFALPGRLPRAEYRYLAVFTEFVGTEGQLPAAQWPAVWAKLAERLGLTLETTGNVE